MVNPSWVRAGAALVAVGWMACAAGEDGRGGMNRYTMPDGATVDRTEGDTAPSDTAPEREVCGNGLDDDGDGSIEEQCACAVGETNSCWPANVDQRGVGACRDGTQVCGGTAEFASFGACERAVLPSEDVPGNGIDEDCNGTDAPLACDRLPPPIAGCTNNVARMGTALGDSVYLTYTSEQAIDGSCGGYWNSGHYAPGWLQIDLGTPHVIHGVALVAQNDPIVAGVALEIQTADDGVTYTTQISVGQVMDNGMGYPFLFPTPVTTRFVRVVTTASPSWVAWTEVAVYSCP